MKKWDVLIAMAIQIIFQILNIYHIFFLKKCEHYQDKKESENDYKKINSTGGGFGAIGKYQIRRDGFKDAGYINNKNQWIGKNNIYSIADFLNNPDAQEKFLDEYFQAKYRQLQSNGSLKYIGYPFKGTISNFDITDTGLLAASHREGAGAVHNFLSHLEKDTNGRYYLNYDAMQDLKQRDIFKHIETRLREFEKQSGYFISSYVLRQGLCFAARLALRFVHSETIPYFKSQ